MGIILSISTLKQMSQIVADISKIADPRKKLKTEARKIKLHKFVSKIQKKSHKSQI